jgi:prohibitin 1
VPKVEKKAAVIDAEGVKQSIIIKAQADAEALELEAEARSSYNSQISNTITPNLLKMKSIEAFENLSQSNNSKLMILDADTPIMNLFGKNSL